MNIFPFCGLHRILNRSHFRIKQGQQNWDIFSSLKSSISFSLLTAFCVFFMGFVWSYHRCNSSYSPCGSTLLCRSCSLKLSLPPIWLGRSIFFSSLSACEIVFLDNNWMNGTSKSLIWIQNSSRSWWPCDGSKDDQGIPGKTGLQGPPRIPGINVKNGVKGEPGVQGSLGQKGASGNNRIA